MRRSRSPGTNQLRNYYLHTTVLATFLLCSLLLLPGCATLARPQQQQANPSTSHIQMDVYGDLRGWEAVPFEDQPFSSLTQHSFCTEGGDFDPDLSADGLWVVLSSLRHAPNPDLYIKRVEGSTVTRLTSDPASEIQPAFSPVADKVAYASNRANNWDIWVIGVDGSNSVQLTSGPANDIHPSWSPDGKQIVYCSLGPRSQQWELWIVDVQTPSIKKFIGYGLFPEWCPEPSIPKITYQQARYRGSQWFSVWTLDIVGGEAKYPTEIVTSAQHACICPDWSRDGGQLTYGTVGSAVYEPQGQPEPVLTSGQDIWIVDLDGKNNLKLTNADAANFSPCWGPGGRVYFCSDRSGIENIWSVKPRPVSFVQDKVLDLTRHPQSTIQAN